MPPKSRRPQPKASTATVTAASRSTSTRKRTRGHEPDRAVPRRPNGQHLQDQREPNSSTSSSPLSRSDLSDAPSARARTRPRRERVEDARTRGEGDEDQNAAGDSGVSSASRSPGGHQGNADVDDDDRGKADYGAEETSEGDDDDAAEDSSRRSSASRLRCRTKAEEQAGMSDAELAAALEKRLVDYSELQSSIGDLQGRRQAAGAIARLIAASQDPMTNKFPVIRLVVGGESFTVPIITLLSRDQDTYFHSLLSALQLKDERVSEDLATTSSMAAAALGLPASAGKDAAPAAAAVAAAVDATKPTGTPTAGGTACDGIASCSSYAGVGTKPSGDERDSQPPWLPIASIQYPQRQPTGQPDDDSEGEDGFRKRLSERKRTLTSSSSPAEVFTDSTGAVFIDRDPDTFRHVLNYLRGYSRFRMLGEEELGKLRVDAQYYRLQGLQELIGETDTSMDLLFQPGPGINAERSRFRVVYSVATVGEAFMITGRHSITFQILSNDYVGLGLVSDAFANTDAEFHKTLNCAVYYMSGVFYTNYPNYRKEEGLAKFENGDYVTFLVDMDKGFAEVTVKRATKLFALGGARRLKFAVTLKLGSRVRIVPPEEAAEHHRRMALEEAEETQKQPSRSSSMAPPPPLGSRDDPLGPPSFAPHAGMDLTGGVRGNVLTDTGDGDDNGEGDGDYEDDYVDVEENADVLPPEAYVDEELFRG